MTTLLRWLIIVSLVIGSWLAVLFLAGAFAFIILPMWI